MTSIEEQSCLAETKFGPKPKKRCLVLPRGVIAVMINRRKFLIQEIISLQSIKKESSKMKKESVRSKRNALGIIIEKDEHIYLAIS